LNLAANENWIADLETMTCRNVGNNITVVFEPRGKTYQGKINTIPVDILEQWKLEKNVHRRIKKAIIEADAVFFQAYFRREIEKKFDKTDAH